jgi:hypothetical protein
MSIDLVNLKQSIGGEKKIPRTGGREGKYKEIVRRSYSSATKQSFYRNR